MTDELDDLRAAMDAAAPKPDAEAKARNLALARKNFAAIQETASEARPTVSRPVWGRMTQGVTSMLSSISSRGGLTATTALVAVGLFMVLPQGNDLLRPDAPFVEISQPPVPQEGQGNRARVSDGDASVAAKAPQALPETRADLELLAPTAPAPALPKVRRELSLADSVEEESFATSRGAASDDMALSQSEPMIATEAPQPSIEMRRVPLPEVIVVEEANTEAFANAPANSVKSVATDPVSTFSIDVDTASYGVVRSSLTQGMLPPQDAVRIEEMVNYFPYAYPTPEGPHPFQPTVTLAPTPWNPETSLLHIAIQGTPPATETAPPLNLVFLIDTSGSMQDANKLPLLKQSFRLMLSELRPEDEVAIVTYAGSAGRVLDPTPAREQGKILAALDNLRAGGSTAGQAGLQQAYATAEEMAADADGAEVSRVILATDGDFNVGISSPEALKDFIAEKRDSGTYLSVLGFGRGNLDDATMQALAQNGNGQASYIDTLSEARKVLVDQLSGALFPIANDVKIQIEFNPAQIAEYRLLGYETRALRNQDFNNDKVDAGDIGAGHSVTAIYELTPVGSAAVLNTPLRYGEQTVLPRDPSGELGFLKLRYKAPGETRSQLIETPILPGAGTPNSETAFASAIAGFGQLLRGGDFTGTWSYDDAIALANGARGDDPFGYRAEAIQLMRLAEALDR